MIPSFTIVIVPVVFVVAAATAAIAVVVPAIAIVSRTIGFAPPSHNWRSKGRTARLLPTIMVVIGIALAFG